MPATGQILKMSTPWISELYPVYQGTISAHHAKAGYDYPTVRLPHTFSELVGLPTRIYQTLHDGALAFLVVIAPADAASDNVKISPKSPALTWRRSPVRIRPGPFFQLERKHSQVRSIKLFGSAKAVAAP